MRINVDGSLIVIDQVPFEAINLLVVAASKLIDNKLACDDSPSPIMVIADAMSEIITKKFEDAWNDKAENELLLNLSFAELRAVTAMCSIGLAHIKMEGSMGSASVKSLLDASIIFHRVSSLHIANGNMKCS